MNNLTTPGNGNYGDDSGENNPPDPSLPRRKSWQAEIREMMNEVELPSAPTLSYPPYSKYSKLDRDLKWSDINALSNLVNHLKKTIAELNDTVCIQAGIIAALQLEINASRKQQDWIRQRLAVLETAYVRPGPADEAAEVVEPAKPATAPTRRGVLAWFGSGGR